MARINENYLKLQGAYLFPEIDRRVRLFTDREPAAADRTMIVLAALDPVR